MQGANPKFEDAHGCTALDAAAGGSQEARRALKREAAAQRVCANCGGTPAEGARLKRCGRCLLVQCECGSRGCCWRLGRGNAESTGLLQCISRCCLAGCNWAHLPFLRSADCSTQCQRQHWKKEGGHRQACKSAAIVMPSARYGVPSHMVVLGRSDG